MAAGVAGRSYGSRFVRALQWAGGGGAIGESLLSLARVHWTKDGLGTLERNTVLDKAKAGGAKAKDGSVKGAQLPAGAPCWRPLLLARLCCIHFPGISGTAFPLQCPCCDP